MQKMDAGRRTDRDGLPLIARNFEMAVFACPMPDPAVLHQIRSRLARAIGFGAFGLIVLMVVI